MTPARFFSTAGRTTGPRFLLVGLAAAPLLWPLSTMAWDRGIVANVAIGLLGGVAAAKLIAEGARRLHDMGYSGWRGAAVLLGLIAVVLAVALFSFELPAAVTILTLAAVAVLVALLMLRPGQRVPNRYGEPPVSWWRTAAPTAASLVALASAAVIVLAGAAAGYGVTWLGRGMAVSNAAALRPQPQGASRP